MKSRKSRSAERSGHVALAAIVEKGESIVPAESVRSEGRSRMGRYEVAWLMDAEGDSYAVARLSKAWASLAKSGSRNAPAGPATPPIASRGWSVHDARRIDGSRLRLRSRS